MIGPNATRRLRHGMSHSVLRQALRCGHYPPDKKNIGRTVEPTE
jgi:hypothetical protein